MGAPLHHLHLRPVAMDQACSHDSATLMEEKEGGKGTAAATAMNHRASLIIPFVFGASQEIQETRTVSMQIRAKLIRNMFRIDGMETGQGIEGRDGAKGHVTKVDTIDDDVDFTRRRKSCRPATRFRV